ncbi:MAG: DNA polymerase III subunit delta [Bacteroidetes bacterium]|nr:DNA polymerase III subunit delta [Bacteroidota bacterium]
MEEAKLIASEINKGNFSPLYLLYGEEPYYIDAIADLIEQKALAEEEKAFNQLIVYGKDALIEDIVSQAKRYPMMAERQLIVVKEAQHLSEQIDGLQEYAKHPLQSTILVLCYKYQKPDKRKGVFKAFQKNGTILESKKIYDNKIPSWINDLIHHKGFTAQPAVPHLLFEFLGTDLSRIEKEIDKLSIHIEKGALITPDIVEQHIGISKDYNNFELKKAIGERDILKAFKIVHYFAHNPKDNPFLMTVSILHSFFTQIMQYHGLTDHNPNHVAASLGISPYFINEIKNAAKQYPMKRVSQILKVLKDLDLKNKGMGAPTDHQNLLKELLIKIL